ncbi:MAG: ATP-binding protein [Muribaculum sp.]|nr:ATP-binding protein [Muribaculum sp.]
MRQDKFESGDTGDRGNEIIEKMKRKFKTQEDFGRKNKYTLFRIFLVPLTAVMLAQSLVALGTLLFRNTGAMLQNYSVSMMSRMVENRKVILQNDMTQRWSAVSAQEDAMNAVLEGFLRRHNVTLEQALSSKELRDRLLEELFPQCIAQTENNLTTGVFLVLTDGEFEEAEEFDGFFIRDSNPYTSQSNYSDLLMERGNKRLARTYRVPLDTDWTTAFAMSGQGQRQEENFFYEPWRAARENSYAASKDLGYWSAPFVLGEPDQDSHEMITYSIPLRYQGEVYAVMGVEIAVSYLCEYLPVQELDEEERAGYCLAVDNGDGSYTALVGSGVLYQDALNEAGFFTMHKTGYENLYAVEHAKFGSQYMFAVCCPLKIYGSHAPYEDTEWVLIGLNSEEELFGMTRTLYLWMLLALLIGFVFSLAGIYLVVHRITRPIKHLMACISRGRSGLQEFVPTDILEVDALYEVVADLTEKQLESENVLREEKELYRLVLESTKDTFFSYNFKDDTIDIINDSTFGGHWSRREYGTALAELDMVHEEEREQVREILKLQTDAWRLECRIRRSADSPYQWMRLSGNVIRDAEGERRRAVGSLHNIQAQKDREEQERRKVAVDSVTGFWAYVAGKERLGEARKNVPGGVMVYFMLDNLRQIDEQNGITFGDMILEEIGRIVRKNADVESILIRFDGNEFCAWLPGRTEEDARNFVKTLFEQIEERFHPELFQIMLHAGIVAGNKNRSTNELTRMAKQAQMAASKATDGTGYCRYGKEAQRQGQLGAGWKGRQIVTVDYGENVSLVSLALTLFGRGENLAAQMYLIFQKLGRYYSASDVLLVTVQPDFHTVYLEYQWHDDPSRHISAQTMLYREDEWNAFVGRLGEERILVWDEEKPLNPLEYAFCRAEDAASGCAVPLYDNGNVMGIFTILNGRAPEEEESDAVKNLLELCSVIQSQINQKRHDLASKAKSDFLSRMSHEIRTPMNGIIGMTAIALQAGQDQERVQDCLQKIRTSSDYLLSLINDILDMSKIESGKMHLEPADFSMREMLSTIEELIRPQAQAKSIEFARDVDIRHDWFVADKLRLSQVLINLLGNAVKFTQEHGKVFLTIREEEQGDGSARVYFGVRDTGIGISEKDQERVFRAFEQARTTTESRQKGTGLGLSISNRLIQMMGSSIELESRPGEGSTFFFTLSMPFGKAQDGGREEGEISFDGYRILVVEDNELNSEIARTLLEESHFQVDCVYDGSQAVKRIAETEPGTYDLILMDIMMPVMDGLDATRAIRGMQREDCRTIPIIAMSANAFDEDLKKSVECGMNGHLSKPVEIDKMYAMLKKILADAPRSGH